MDLVTFLRARLDEDDRCAEVADDAVVDWIADDTGESGEEAAGRHIARWKPSRVLLEVAAKRAIVALYEELNEPHLYEALQHLALPYAHNHPDYDAPSDLPA